MIDRINIDVESQIPVYKQLISYIERLILSGEYAQGYQLPSMNELSAQIDISKETVKKAYSILRDNGYIEAKQGKGYYVSNIVQERKLNILVLFDKLSTYKNELFNAFAHQIGHNAEIVIHMHNQNVDLFEHYINESLDLYDYYVITPHFPLDSKTQKRVLKIISRIPNRKLILADRWLKELPGNYGAVYQDFENDAYKGLMYGLPKLQSCTRLNVVTLPSSLYCRSVRQSVENFCNDNRINVKFYNKITSDIVRPNEVYLLLNSQVDNGLIELARIAKAHKYVVGEDISIISYNESPINEIILNGLTTISTDFCKMGSLIAQMILNKQLEKIHCDFQMIRRGTF